MLINLINDQLLKNRAAEPKRTYIGASLIGKECLRSIWYEYNDYEGIPFTGQQLMTFEIGKQLEKLIKRLTFNDARFYETSELESECKTIKGTPDLIYEKTGYAPYAMIYNKEKLYGDMVIEIKTANNTSFNQFKKQGLRKWRQSYYAQIQCYMGMSKIPKGILLCINKDNSEMHEEEVQFDELYYKSLLLKAQSIKQSTEAPDRIATTPMHPACRMCQYREVCWNE